MTKVCDYCGQVTDRVTRTAGNEYDVCDECLDNDFLRCDECGEYYERGGEIDTYNNGTLALCDDCRNDYIYCDECGELIPQRDASDDGRIYLCEYCRDELYTMCTACDRYIREGNIYYDRRDEPYCWDCYCELEDDDNIHDYDYKPEPIFEKLHGETPAGYYGVELEIDEGHDRDECADAINDISDGTTYNKRDGSLNNGFEIVSHPCTLAYHLHALDWEKILETAREYGFTSHSAGTCGLHIHVSNTIFGNEPMKRDLNIAKLMLVFNEHWDNIITFSRRTESQVNDWCKRPSNEILENDTEREIINKVNDEKCRGRYRAINLTNWDTVEIRIFRGTLRYETFIATLQFTDYLINYCNNTPLKTLFKKSFKNIFKDCQYEELNHYLSVKGLI